MTRKQEMREARRRAAREGQLPAAVPDVLVTCDRETCRDERRQGQFVERFRWSGNEGRWVGTARTAETHLRPDGTPTTDTVGWDGPAPERSRWPLRCSSCGHSVPARDAKLQAAFEILRRQAEVSRPGGGTVHASLVLLEGMLARLRDVPPART
jgi:hypothetical protein